MDPRVGADSPMKDMRPVMMVETDHIGFHDSGWKSDMERQRRRFGLNLPLGVSIMTEGGFERILFRKY